MSNLSTQALAFATSTYKGTEENPLFQANQIAAVLGMTSIQKQLTELDETEKVILSTNTAGGIQQVIFLTETGLIRVLFRSRKPIAIEFQRWAAKILKELMQSQMKKQLQDKDNANKALQSEVNLLKQASEPRAPCLYVFKVDCTEADIFCHVKCGKTVDISQRETQFAQVAPNGRMVFSAPIPAQFLKDAEDMMHKLLKATGTCLGKRYSDSGEVYMMQLEHAKLVASTVVDLYTIVAAGSEIKWEALTEVVQVLNHHLRGEARTNNLDDSPLNATELQAIRFHLENLKPGASIPHRKEAGQELLSPQSSQNPGSGNYPIPSMDEITDPKLKRAYDFNLYIEECCDLVPGHEESTAILVGRHKTWCRILDGKLHRAINAYLQTHFKPVKIKHDDGYHSGFLGLKVKPVVRTNTVVPCMPELFCQACCSDAPASRLYLSTLKTTFAEWWESQGHTGYEPELKEVRKYLDEHYTIAMQWHPELKSSEYGYYGICIKGEEDKYLRRMVSTTARVVEAVDAVGSFKALGQRSSCCSCPCCQYRNHFLQCQKTANSEMDFICSITIASMMMKINCKHS